MVLDAGTRRQLIEARERIGAQLSQLEGAKMDSYSRGGPPDCREVYEELQKQLQEIDALLGAGDDRESATEPAYEPMVRMTGDGSVGIPTPSSTPVGKVSAVVMFAVLVLSIAVALLRS